MNRKNSYNKLLFVSYNHSRPHFADSIQNHRLLRYLRESLLIDVLCRANQGKSTEDHLICVWSPNIFFLDRILFKIFPYLRPVISIDRFLWSLVAFFRLLFIHKQYDAIIITYEPFSIHPLAAFAKFFCGIKIISVLYDPLVDNLFFHQSSKGRYLRLKLEKKIVLESEFVVVNNEKFFSLLAGRYKMDTIKMIYLCGSDFEYSKFPKSKEVHDKIRIVHCGNIHGKRNLKCLDETIKILKEKIPNLSEKLEFDFYGDCSPSELERIDKSNNGDLIIFKSPVSQNEIPRILLSADALLLIDPLEEGNNSFPSKLCEYFQSGINIYGYTNNNSPSGIVLHKAGQMVCDGTNVDEMAKSICKLVLREQTHELSSLSEYKTAFNPDVVAQRYITIIKSTFTDGVPMD